MSNYCKFYIMTRKTAWATTLNGFDYDNSPGSQLQFGATWWPHPLGLKYPRGRSGFCGGRDFEDLVSDSSVTMATASLTHFPGAGAY